jgi:diacylglycerol kinase (CTP)
MHQQALKQKSDVHLSRKIWHCLGISLMAIIYNVAGTNASWAILLILSGIFIPLDALRQSRPSLNQLTMKLFGPIMRSHESSTLSGMTHLFLGCMFLLLLNEPHIVTLTLLFLAFGDPVASFFGIRFGKDKLVGHKTLQGTIAAFVVCSLISCLYYYFNNIMTERLLIVAPLSGLIGAIAELIPVGKMDDNLTFPIMASILLWLLFQLYGGIV